MLGHSYYCNYNNDIVLCPSMYNYRLMACTQVNDLASKSCYALMNIVLQSNTNMGIMIIRDHEEVCIYYNYLHYIIIYI